MTYKPFWHKNVILRELTRMIRTYMIEENMNSLKKNCVIPAHAGVYKKIKLLLKSSEAEEYACMYIRVRCSRL